MKRFVAILGFLVIAAGAEAYTRGYGQQAVTTGAAQVLTLTTCSSQAANPRTMLAITNTDTANTLYVSNSAAETTSTGYPVLPKATYVIGDALDGQFRAAQIIYGTAAGGTITTGLVEDCR